jgi:crotonobetainyl-CoA:carnitine CoA-transferase CaiB-like acyl-CoA transferase
MVANEFIKEYTLAMPFAPFPPGDPPDGRRGPLQGIRILDLTRVMMGPLATQILADQGADVVMIEALEGDTCRVMGPGPHPQLSGIALNLLRNKRSAQVDLKTADGLDLVHRLAATCDAVVTTMRPEVLCRLKLGYATISAIKPDIVYCQAQGFPLDGPRANDPAYDDIIQAATGVVDTMDRVWGHPTLMPTILADKVCGLVISQAVTAALLHKHRTGQGQHVEVAMRQSMIAFMLAEHGSGAISEPPVRFPDTPAAGYPRVLSVERRPQATKDGLVHLFPYLPRHYAAIFAEAGRADADRDPRYADQRATLRNSDSLYRDIRSIAGLRTTEEWLEYCRAVGIPATRVATLQDLVDELPLATHPTVGRYRVIPTMARFAQAADAVRRPAPLIGQDTDDVVAELDALTADGRAVESGGSGGGLQ